MYNFFAKNGQLIALLAGIFFLLLLFIPILTGFPAGADVDQLKETGIFNLGLYATYFLIAIAVFALIGFGLYQIFINPKGAMKGLITFGILAAIIVLFVMLSGAGDLQKAPATWAEYGITAGKSKFIGGIITTAIVMVVVGFLAIFGLEARNLFKK